MAKDKSLGNTFFGNFSTGKDDEIEEDEVEIIEDKDKEEDEKSEEIEKDKVEPINEEEESSEDNEEQDSDPFIDTINHLAEKGILVFDEDKEYEEEGEELLEKVFQETRERDRQEWIDEIPEEFQSIIKHIKAGGSLEDWVEAVKPTDFDSINLEDESNQKALIEDHLSLTGMDEDDIKDRIQELEDSGTLEKNAKIAVKYLKKNEDKKVKAYEEELDRVEQAQEEQKTKALDDFKKEVLATESLKDLKLDKTERQKLLDHIIKPVNKRGESQFVLNQKSRENQLLVGYMDMKGFSLKDLETKVETRVTSKLRNSLSRITDTNAKGTGGTTTKAPPTDSKKIPKGPWG